MAIIHLEPTERLARREPRSYHKRRLSGLSRSNALRGLDESAAASRARENVWFVMGFFGVATFWWLRALWMAFHRDNPGEIVVSAGCGVVVAFLGLAWWVGLGCPWRTSSQQREECELLLEEIEMSLEKDGGVDKRDRILLRQLSRPYSGQPRDTRRLAKRLYHLAHESERLRLPIAASPPVADTAHLPRAASSDSN
jgi:hypothetical protein